MFGGSSDPNMLFHSSFTFESCLTCFLAIKTDSEVSLKGASKTGMCFYCGFFFFLMGKGQQGLHIQFVFYDLQYMYIYVSTH